MIFTDKQFTFVFHIKCSPHELAGTCDMCQITQFEHNVKQPEKSIFIFFLGLRKRVFQESCKRLLKILILSVPFLRLISQSDFG